MRDAIDTAGLYLSDSMWADQISGDSDSPTGHFALVTDLTDATFPLLAHNFDDNYSGVAELTVAEFGEHVVITGDSCGFIYVTAYDTAEEARAEYDRLEAEYSAWVDADEDIVEQDIEGGGI